MRMAISPRLAISSLWKDIDVSVQAPARNERVTGSPRPRVPPHTPTAARYGRRFNFLLLNMKPLPGFGASGISFHNTEFT
jgi:hypothetical protein